MLVSVNIFVSLDGVVQGPGAPDEDRSGGFDRGGWLVPFNSQHTDEVVTGWFREADAFLFGRTSFEMLRGYWPKVTDPANVIASQLNALPKYVVSSTLADDESGWAPSTVLRGEAVDDVRRLTELPGRELQVHGSWKLVRTLLEAGLVPTTFEVVPDRSRVLPGGVTALTLTPRDRGGISAGSFVVQDGRSTTNLE